MVLTTLLLSFVAITSVAQAQSISDIRWKSESQVRAILGEPRSVSSPVGTHARYTVWKYSDFTVAFSNNKAFHLFRNNSLNRLKLQENR